MIPNNIKKMIGSKHRKISDDGLMTASTHASELKVGSPQLPSDKRLHNYGKMHPFYSWVNPLFLWSCSIANLVHPMELACHVG